MPQLIQFVFQVIFAKAEQHVKKLKMLQMQLILDMFVLLRRSAKRRYY